MPRVLNVNKIVVEVGLENGSIIEIERRKFNWNVKKGEEIDVFGSEEKLTVLKKNTSNHTSKSGGLFKRILLIIFFIFIFVFVVNVVSSLGKDQNITGDTDGVNQNETVDIPDLEIVNGNVEIESDSFASYFVGIVQNNTNKDYSYAQIVFNLYDKDGNLVGTALDNINNIKAGGTWKFKALALEEYSTWELDEITGW